MGKIYLDYAATTPTHPEVLKEMLLFFMEVIMSKAEEQVQRKIFKEWLMLYLPLLRN